MDTKIVILYKQVAQLWSVGKPPSSCIAERPLSNRICLNHLEARNRKLRTKPVEWRTLIRQRMQERIQT